MRIFPFLWPRWSGRGRSRRHADSLPYLPGPQPSLRSGLAAPRHPFGDGLRLRRLGCAPGAHAFTGACGRPHANDRLHRRLDHPRANGLNTTTPDRSYLGISTKKGTSPNSLPGAPSRIDGIPRNLEIFKGELNPNLPHVPYYPQL